MGSAISSLPEKLNENEMKTICGIHYEAPLFQSLRDPTDGLVRKDFFLGFFLFLISFSFLSFNSYFYLSFFFYSFVLIKNKTIALTSDSLEKEVYYVFLEFCPTGEMDSRLFSRLLKDTKSFKKNNFTIGEADLIFQKYKTKYQIKKYLNYYIFRIDLIPSIAYKKQIEILEYLQKLSKCKGPSYNNTTEPEEMKFSSHPLIPKENVALFSATDEQINAAIKLQNFHRKTQAKIDVTALREVPFSSPFNSYYLFYHFHPDYSSFHYFQFLSL